MKLMPISYLRPAAIVLMSLLVSCDDIIEPSITKSQVIIEAPADQVQSTNYSTNFWWDKVDHALFYELQVVTPNFAAPASLVLDTIINKNTFSVTLSPGTYQWRVMAQNGSSQTAFSADRTFTIIASSIKQQAVQLNSPANNLITNQSTLLFQWGSLFGTTKYQFQIDTNNFVNDSVVVYNKVIPGQQISFNFPKKQVYQWRVRGQNDTAQAKWSAVYQVTFNNTPPAQVTLVAPVNGATVTLPVTLQWKAVTNAAKYKLSVYQSDGVTNYSSSFPMVLTSTSYSFNSGSSGTKVYWTVTAIDAVGNESVAASPVNFVIQ